MQSIFIIFSLIIVLLHLENSAPFLQKIRTILMGGKNNKPKVWEFVSANDLQYPGNNPQKIRKIQEAWNSYYNCLTTHYSDLGPHKSIKPEILMVFEGTSVKLNCKTCVPPSDISRIDDVLWNYRTIPPTSTRLVELGEHKLISPQDKTLHMFGLTQQDTGQYFCQRGNTVTAAYFLEVINSNEPVQEVHPETSGKEPYPEPPKLISEENKKLITVWSEWSKCSTCGVVGKRIRYGICTVQHMANSNSSKSELGPGLATKNTKSIQNETSTEKLSTTTSGRYLNQTTTNLKKFAMQYFFKEFKQYAINEIYRANSEKTMSQVIDHSNLYEDIVHLFPDGIPCRSKLLPNYDKNLPSVQERKSEIMTGFCKEPCPKPLVFQVIDNKGNVLETANNSAGIFSTLQGIPHEKPTVERETIYEDTLSTKIVLRCPGNLNSDVPLQWQIGSFNIDSVTVYVLSRGRIIINILDQIVINEPQVTDSNIYSCWQDGELAGTIRLLVKKRLELSFNHEIMMISMILIMGTFVLVAFRAFRARNRPEAE